MLIAGRAGLGKTTLAHVIAKHVGYDVLEINARYVRRSYCTVELHIQIR